jgi:hypothetical protein
MILPSERIVRNGWPTLIGTNPGAAADGDQSVTGRVLVQHGRGFMTSDASPLNEKGGSWEGRPDKSIKSRKGSINALFKNYHQKYFRD